MRFKHCYRCVEIVACCNQRDNHGEGQVDQLIERLRALAVGKWPPCRYQLMQSCCLSASATQRQRQTLPKQTSVWISKW